MSLLSIPFKYTRNRFQDPLNKKVYLKIDATVNLSYRRSAALTKYPIEDGSEISDHYTLGNKMLSVQGIISTTPIEVYSGALNVLTGLIPNATVRTLAAGAKGAGELLLRTRGGSLNQAKRAYNYLNELMTKKIPFTFTTKYERYKNMLITSLDISRTPETGDSLPFSCEMEEVHIVSAKKGDIGVLDKINGKSANKFDLPKKEGVGAGLATSKDSSLFQLGQFTGTISQ